LVSQVQDWYFFVKNKIITKRNQLQSIAQTIAQTIAAFLAVFGATHEIKFF